MENGHTSTFVRGVVLPAVLTLLCRATWWAPAPLRRAHDRVGWREDPDEPVPDPTSAIRIPIGVAG